jgi:hypothetical protein
MSENKYCGNCKHFKNEDVEGWGWCSFNKTKTHCAQSWDCHNNTFNGWTEITPDNVDMIDDGSIVIVTDGTYYNKASEWHLSIGTMAKDGGYYYYVLPELKIE